MEPSQLLIKEINKSLSLQLKDDISSQELLNQLKERVNQLITNDFNQLVSILYRVDVNEQKLKTLLKDNPSTDAAQIIAGLIIDRQFQKIQSRKEFNKENENIDEDEKW